MWARGFYRGYVVKIAFEDESEGLYQPSLWSNRHLWREILFNARPNAQCEPFQDGRGQTHWLAVNHSGTDVTLTVHHRGGVIALAAIEWVEPDEAILQFLHVACSCRKHGLATHLVNRVVALAGQHGARYLTGRIIRKHTERTPALLNWYRQRGFVVEPVLAVPLAGPLRPLSKIAQQSQLVFETVATLSLNLDTTR